MELAGQLGSISLYSRLWSIAERNPEAVAIRDSGRLWTWRALLERAAAYRDALEEGANPSGQAVPILVDRSGETVAAILGVLLSGRAFSPLSPDQPLERIGACLIALKARELLLPGDPRWNSERFAKLQVEPIVLEAGKSGIPTQPEDPEPEKLLYVLFTSGSTGTPKGVMVTFGNIENTMMWSMDVLDWQADDTIGNVAPFFFDISMFDLFSTFYFGVPTAVLSRTADVHNSLMEIAEHRITSIFSAPVFFSQFLRTGLLGDSRLNSLRRIVSGGDFFPPAHVLAWLQERPATEVWNVWGPTETSIVNTMHRVNSADLPLLQSGKHPPVGRAHPRMPFVLLDGDRQVDDPHEPGEICMLGACVTRGYLGDEERTRDAYFEWNSERAFRTRDIGLVDEAGNLFMVGRIGSMVKVAGYRIDLGEVESAAARIPDILLAGAFVHEAEPGLHQLYLALEPRADCAPDLFSIKQRLRQLLPSYMIPKRLFILDELPKSPNGKIDRRALAGLLDRGGA